MKLSNAKVAVTGATGFIGRYIVRALSERGAHVIAVVRNPDKAPWGAGSGVEVRKADLSDEDALAAGFAGADAVISNAALMQFTGSDPDELIRSNIEGVRNVFGAIARAGVERVVHNSSASVYRSKPGRRYTEDDPLRTEDDKRGRFTLYPISKAIGEREAWRLADEHGNQLTVMRPSGVFGAFDKGGFTHHFGMLVSWPIAPFPTHTYVPNSYAGDVAEAMCLALEKPASVGRVYNIASAPGERTFWDHYKAWKEAGGKTPSIVIPLPVPFRVEYSIERAERDLGWSNRPLVDGFSDMFAFERAEQ